MHVMGNGRIDGDLEGLPGEEAAALAEGREGRAEEGEHVAGGEAFDVSNCAALDVFDQHRGGGLADSAAGAREIRLAD